MIESIKRMDTSSIPLDENGSQLNKDYLYKALNEMSGVWSFEAIKSWQEPYHYFDNNTNSYQLYGNNYYVMAKMTVDNVVRSGIGVVTRQTGDHMAPLAYQDAEFVALMQCLQKFSIGTMVGQSAPLDSANRIPTSMTDEELEDSLPFNNPSSDGASVMGEAKEKQEAKVNEYKAEEANINLSVKTFDTPDGKGAWGTEESIQELSRLKANRERLQLYTDQLLIPLLREFLQSEEANIQSLSVDNIAEFNTFLETNYSK